MRFPLFLTTILAFAFTIARAAAADPAVYPPMISTTGSAEIRLVPDFADLYFNIDVRRADLASARKEQAERTAKILAVLRSAGIDENDVQTSQVSISTIYVRSGNYETATVDYYAVSQNISFTMRNVKKVGEVTADVVLAGANGVGDVVLRTSDLRKRRDEARLQAARAAREKAVALAKELGVKIGKPYSIDEFNANSVQSNASTTSVRAGGEGDEPQATFAPGMVSVQANVRVSFLLE